MVGEQQIGGLVLVDDENDREQLMGSEDRVDDVLNVHLYGGLDVILPDRTRQPVQVLPEKVSLAQPRFILSHKLFHFYQADFQDVGISGLGYTFIDLNLIYIMVAGVPTRGTLDSTMIGTKFLQEDIQVSGLRAFFLGVDLVVEEKNVGSLLKEFLEVHEPSIWR